MEVTVVVAEMVTMKEKEEEKVTVVVTLETP